MPWLLRTALRASVVLLLFKVTLSAQSANPDIRVDTTLVVIPVTVTDAKNRFVLGLEKKDFTLLEDGVEQKITQFAGEDAPVSAGLLMDTSGSMGDKLELARKSVDEFLNTMNRQDESSLIEFNDQPQLVAPFPAPAQEIREKLQAVAPQGLTALLDAISLGLKEMKRARNPRKALVVFSDGGDNHSRYTAEQIKDLVREADVQVYSMGVFDKFPIFALSAAEISGPKLLSQLSEQTGGRAFSVSEPRDLPVVASRIGIELRNQYVLAYAPSNRKRDGSYRKVEVRLKAPPGLPPLKARWRLGYYAASSP